jgi:hypothetical protein
MRSSAAMGQRARRMQSSALPALFAAFSLRVRPSSTVHFSFSTSVRCRFLDAFGAHGSPQRDALACASRDPRVPLRAG